MAVLLAKAGNQPRHFRVRGRAIQPLEARPIGGSLGRWLEKAQVRRPVLGAPHPLAFRGERRSEHALFQPSARTVDVRLSLSSCFCSLPLPARLRPFTAWSRTLPAPRVTGATVALINRGGVVATAVTGPTAAFRSSPASRGASSLSSRPRAFASWRRPASMPAVSTTWSATWCWNPRGCASPSWSRPPERPRRSRRPARPPPCWVRRTWLCATIWSALCA